MAKIKCPKKYNWWYILSYTGIDPTKDLEKYKYDEEKEELWADVTQYELERALGLYDHKAWLKELGEIENPENNEQETLETEMVMLAIADLDLQREQDKIETQLAIAELAETILGGVE